MDAITDNTKVGKVQARISCDILVNKLRNFTKVELRV